MFLDFVLALPAYHNKKEKRLGLLKGKSYKYYKIITNSLTMRFSIDIMLVLKRVRLYGASFIPIGRL